MSQKKKISEEELHALIDEVMEKLERAKGLYFDVTEMYCIRSAMEEALRNRFEIVAVDPEEILDGISEPMGRGFGL